MWGKDTSWLWCGGEAQWLWPQLGSRSSQDGAVWHCVCPAAAAAAAVEALPWPGQSREEVCVSQLAALGLQQLLGAGCGSVVSAHSRNGAAKPAARGARHRENWQSRGEGTQVLVLHPEQGPCCLCGETGQDYLAEGTKQCRWGGEWLRNAKTGGRVVRGFAASVVKCAVLERAQEGISRWFPFGCTAPTPHCWRLPMADAVCQGAPASHQPPLCGRGALWSGRGAAVLLRWWGTEGRGP